MTDFIIRPPEEKDVEALAQLHFYMWNTFYKDFVPESYSKKYYTIEQCREYQRDMLEGIKSSDKEFARVVFDNEKQQIAALCYINQNDVTEDNDLYIPGIDLELQHIYIWPEYRDKNLGGRLFYAVLEWIKEHGYQSVYWWVLDLNPYSFIHTKHGAKIIKQMPRDYTGTILNLTAYGWEDSDEQRASA